METGQKAQEMLNQAGSRAVETLTAWADANQRVMRELVELSTATAKESVRLYGELQQGALESLRDVQATGLRWQAAWQDGVKDPGTWYQTVMGESVEAAQKSFRTMEAGAQAVTRSAERLQASAEQTGKAIQETLTAVVAKARDVCTRA
jgi:hypothetical protein